MLLRLTNVPRDYSWGSTALLAELEGRAPSAQPEAEVWFGDHPGDPADVVGGGTLDTVTGGGLPYLLKLLAAAEPLSIQVHPTLDEARAGWERESELPLDDPHRNYRDDNHKPELIVALSERFDALSGLRPVVETLRLLAGFDAVPGVVALRDRLSARRDALRDTIGWLLSGEAQAEVEGIIRGLATASSPEFATELQVARSIAEKYPNDPGVVVALLMNHVVLRRGEAMFVGAGVLHAYLAGLGVEIMAASDNVLRGGLTPKHVDVAALLTVLDATPGPVPVLRPAKAGGIAEYAVPIADFTLRRVTVSGASVEVVVQGPTIALVTAGDVHISGTSPTSDASGRVPVGTALFADAEERHLLVSGDGEVFIASPG